jgi:outer membrane immunogenic protein
MNVCRALVWGAAVGVALTGLAASASADGPPSYRGSPYVAPFSWSGIYIGGHAGGAWSDADFIFDQPTLPLRERISTNASGFAGGGQIGLQHQWGSLVAGIELSYTGANLDETVTSTAVADRSRSEKISDIFLAGVRLGYAFDRSLLYVKGGYANATVDIDTHVISTGTLTGSSSKRENGWNLGAGWEHALSRNIIVGVQYDFIQLDGTDRLNVNTAGFVTGNHLDLNTDIHVVTARLSYKFGREETAMPLK